jgi:hypothetical protein
LCHLFLKNHRILPPMDHFRPDKTFYLLCKPNPKNYLCPRLVSISLCFF